MRGGEAITQEEKLNQNKTQQCHFQFWSTWTYICNRMNLTWGSASESNQTRLNRKICLWKYYSIKIHQIKKIMRAIKYKIAGKLKSKGREKHSGRILTIKGILMIISRGCYLIPKFKNFPIPHKRAILFSTNIAYIILAWKYTATALSFLFFQGKKWTCNK